jgi:hypothetical protein
MQKYYDCPQILRDFLIYHETIKGQSQLTISEYHLDLRMFLRFVKLMRKDMPISTQLEDIPIKDIDVPFLSQITTSDVFDFLSYLANDRAIHPEGGAEYGIWKDFYANDCITDIKHTAYMVRKVMGLARELGDNPKHDAWYQKYCMPAEQDGKLVYIAENHKTDSELYEEMKKRIVR